MLDDREYVVQACLTKPLAEGVLSVRRAPGTDPDTDRQILDVLFKCQSTLLIPAKLSSGVRSAHKTGSIDHLANDCGIVYTDCGNYVLTMGDEMIWGKLP